MRFERGIKMTKNALQKLDKKIRARLKDISNAIKCKAKDTAKYKFALHGYLDALYDLKIISMSEWYELYDYYKRGNEE